MPGFSTERQLSLFPIFPVSSPSFSFCFNPNEMLLWTAMLSALHTPPNPCSWLWRSLRGHGHSTTGAKPGSRYPQDQTSLTRGSSSNSKRGAGVLGDACPSLFAPAGRRRRGREEQQQLWQRLAGGNHTTSSVLGSGCPTAHQPCGVCTYEPLCGCWLLVLSNTERYQGMGHETPLMSCSLFFFCSCPRTTAVTRMMRKKTKISFSVLEQQRAPGTR